MRVTQSVSFPRLDNVWPRAFQHLLKFWRGCLQFDDRAKMHSLLRKPMESYKGRQIECAPGTHARLIAIISRNLKPHGPVLDIGAHSGALLLRLKELGFSDLTGSDLDPTRFDLSSAEIKRMELNEPFSHHLSTWIVRERFSVRCTTYRKRTVGSPSRCQTSLRGKGVSSSF